MRINCHMHLLPILIAASTPALGQATSYTITDQATFLSTLEAGALTEDFEAFPDMNLPQTAQVLGNVTVTPTGTSPFDSDFQILVSPETPTAPANARLDMFLGNTSGITAFTIDLGGSYTAFGANFFSPFSNFGTGVNVGIAGGSVSLAQAELLDGTESNPNPNANAFLSFTSPTPFSTVTLTTLAGTTGNGGSSNGLEGFGLDNITFGNLQGTGLDGDLDGDGFVGVTDLDLLLANWGQSIPGSPIDADGNGTIGQGDLDIVNTTFGQGTPPGGVVPEPTSVIVLGLGGLLLVRRRRRCA